MSHRSILLYLRCIESARLHAGGVLQARTASTTAVAMRPSDNDSKKDKEPLVLDLRTPKTDRPHPSPISKLKTVLAGMKVDGSKQSSVDEREREDVRKRPAFTHTADVPRKEESTTAAPRVDPQLVDAVEKVSLAFAPKIDPATVKSELLAKLLDHAEQTDKAKASAADLSHLIAGMKIDRSKPPVEVGAQVPFQAFEETAQKPIRAMMETVMNDSAVPAASDRARPRQPPPVMERIDIFGGRPLEIFKDVESLRAKPQFRLKIWQQLEEESLQSLMSLPPRNAFEEMVNWTKEGKLWNFPIDNEQGVLDHEKNVDFSEHVFLHHLLAGFPKKGPIRQFMDIAVYALSKNPFLTVREKEEHVDWFREYFMKKQDLIVDVMGQEMGTVASVKENKTQC
ncbi:28S ribosomal protein S31, mitochondrial-like [Paramacrobiotus metropolitanus]|uniref:28S ribosomal protein S31, mitochondrial-like n=1 Tax=Paramacrobiotus metropolitanus TaxID=2943436 RepID=UPI0024461DF5|nr:28S ribosomal protein S31, mitochondrial-like [Paramacrobiotus metropolitanus]